MAMGLSTFGPGKAPPDSFRRGIQSDDALSLTMWKCNSWGGNGTCKFSNKTEEEVKDVAKLPFSPEMTDKCNEYGDCKTCISASTDNVKCGWCLGGTLSYEGIGKTPYKCGGFVKDTP
jgi:hypothetical protein